MRSQLILLATAFATSFSAAAAGDCNTGYTLCAPNGATSATAPTIGSSDFQNLFDDIVSSSLPTSKRSEITERGSASLCCVSSLSCLAMANLDIPFCYDKFTTNYYLPDGSYGTVVGGSYTSSTGDHANLETGDYTLANGTTGNIYSSNEAAKPNTATLPIPTQFTGTGVGSAIPVSSLGSPVTLTYTLTIPGTTVNPSTVSGGLTLETVTLPTTATMVISGSTVTSTESVGETTTTSLPGSVMPGTTRAAETTTVTTTSVAGAATAAATTSKKSDAQSVGIHVWEGVLVVLGMAVLGL